MPLLRRPIVSVLGHDEMGRAKAAQSQARNAHRPPKMNGAEHDAMHPSVQLTRRHTSPLAPPPHAASPE